MDKCILEQYCDMREEARDLLGRIEKGEKYLAELSEEGYQVSDCVKGTRRDGTIGNIKITGFPLPEYERVKRLTQKRIEKLKGLQEKLLETINQVDDFIEKIPRSDLRMIFRFYYLDDLTWVQVAHRMNSRGAGRGAVFSDDSCRKRHDRYLGKI